MKCQDDMWMTIIKSFGYQKDGLISKENKKQGSSNETIEYNINGSIEFVTTPTIDI